MKSIWAAIVLAATRLIADEPATVTLCDLIRDPSAYDHKRIQVTAFATHGFENFTLIDPGCPEWPSVWLEYGGTFASGTIYCCGGSAGRARPEPLEVDGIATTITVDSRLREFDRLIQREPDRIVRATLVGRFFAGEKRVLPGGAAYGYGHFGCCTLLVIENVVAVDRQDRRDVDYRVFADPPPNDGAGCFTRHLLSMTPFEEAIEAQRQAEAGTREWSFVDPQRVAGEALSALLDGSKSSGMTVRAIRKTKARVTYEVTIPGRSSRFQVVVSRPYWLTYYASDPERIAWVVIASYESGCDDDRRAAD